jgi:broad specificity phosphatase PhoE
MLRPDDTLHFFTSPYRRTRETTEGILSTLTRPDDGDIEGHDDGGQVPNARDVDDSDDADDGPSPFQRSKVKVYEEPRLREQDFGNFQPCSAEMERMWQERADYGHFFYRIPNGESAADAYDRVSGFNESLWRQFGEDDFASVCVLVTHGLMSRVFLMKWYHFTVERFEDLRNVNHCEFLVMRRQDDTGKYLLENQLRTWSELRKERAALKDAAAANGNNPTNGTNSVAKDGVKLERNKSYAVTRRWGGCPNGCNHSRHYKRRDDLEVLRQKDADHCGNGASSDGLVSGTTTVTTTTRRIAARQRSAISSDDDEQEGGARTSSAPDADVVRTTTTRTTTTSKKTALIVNGSEVERLSSPDAEAEGGPLRNVAFTALEDEQLTPSQRNSIVNAHHLHVHIGRDGGGTYSGHASTAGSDTDASEDDRQSHPSHHHHHRRLASINARLNGDDGGAGSLINGSSRLAKSSDSNEDGEELCRFASRLGDAPPQGVDPGSDGDDELARAETEGRSLRGSVY